jgi:molybdate transport system regulatory protein
MANALNRMFKRVIIRTLPGGVRGGGAHVTDFGRDVAAAYGRAEERARVAIREEFAPLDINIDVGRAPHRHKRREDRKRSSTAT